MLKMLEHIVNNILQFKYFKLNSKGKINKRMEVNKTQITETVKCCYDSCQLFEDVYIASYIFMCWFLSMKIVTLEISWTRRQFYQKMADSFHCENLEILIRDYNMIQFFNCPPALSNWYET